MNPRVPPPSRIMDGVDDRDIQCSGVVMVARLLLREEIIASI
jgi:hypothetical protein